MVVLKAIPHVSCWVALVLAGGILVREKADVASEVKARSFTLVNDKGSACARLVSTSAGGTALILMDEAGIPRALFGLKPDGSPLLRFVAKDGKTPRLTAYTDDLGQVRMEFFNTKSPAPILVCGVNPSGAGHVSLLESSTTGIATKLASFSIPHEGSPQLQLRGRRGPNVIQLRFDEKARPELQIDCDGERRLIRCEDMVSQ